MDLIVEIGNSHEGSLGIATSMVDMAKRSGAKTVKFQMHLAEFEGVQEESFRKIFSLQDDTRQNYWKRVNFSPDNWITLANYTRQQDLEFLCTPFSIEAAGFLYRNNLVSRWKVGSGDAMNLPLIDYLAETNLPLIISTGLVSWSEILELKSRLIQRNVWDNTTLMHCVSMYPTPLAKSGLNILEELKTLGCKVGLSDHSGNWLVPLRAINMGVETIEIHMTPHKLFFGPDTESSLTPEEIELIVRACDTWQVLDENPLHKNIQFEDSEVLRKLFRKGVYWAKNKTVGEIVTEDDFIYRKPMQIIDAKYFETYLNRKIICDVQSGKPVSPSDFA